MNRFRSLVWILVCFASVAGFAGKPDKTPPPATVFNNAYTFYDPAKTYTMPTTAPQDGAWLYGTAGIGSAGTYMDCVHHYEVDATPGSPDYSPFLILGAMPVDVQVCMGLCYSCRLNFGGFKPKTYFTTPNTPGWLPAGSWSLSLRSLNGGGSSDGVNFTLYQVNAAALQSMTVFEAQANDNPAPASNEEIASRAYVAHSDDKVPMVAEFAYGSYGAFPAPPTARFTATWDTGDVNDLEVTNPYQHPGYSILLVPIPAGAATGFHKFTVHATLPSGKNFDAPAYQVFVYNATLEVVVNGIVLPEPVKFVRAATPTIRIQQQDTKGKTLTIAKADWEFHNGDRSINAKAADEPNFPSNSTSWSGTIVSPGNVFAAVTIQTGKTQRTSHAYLHVNMDVTARPDAQWITKQTLCENCFDDFAVKGDLPSAYVFPSITNAAATTKFPRQLGMGYVVALGITGERKGYTDGLLDADGSTILRPSTVITPFPLYRPYDDRNDGPEYANRYTLQAITSGPNRGVWFVTAHNFHTDWAYAVSAFFNPNSTAGADPANYKQWTFDPNCGDQANAACYTQTSLSSCWLSQTTLSYYQAASQHINYFTGAPVDMLSVFNNIVRHEKTFHWQQHLVDYVKANRGRYDIGTIMEGVALTGPDETSVRFILDKLVRNISLTYWDDADGGKAEVLDPPGPFPLVDDASGCGLRDSR